MEKYEHISNMSRDFKKIIGSVARPSYTEDKQMKQKIRKLFYDLGQIRECSKNF